MKYIHLNEKRLQKRTVKDRMAGKRRINSQKHINRLLPAEMLERVFHLLPPRDLKAVVLVCRWWREVGEAPALWVWVYIVVTEDNMSEVLDSRRLQAVRRVEVREVSEELLQAVVRHPGLKEMVVVNSNLSLVDPELLAQAVTQLEEVGFGDTWLGYTQSTPQQVTAICTAIRGNSQLKRLKLWDNKLSSVNSDILAQAVTQLEEVVLRDTHLTTQQVTTICTAMTGNSKLKKLNLSQNNLSSVDANILAKAVTQLEEVGIGFTHLTPHQVGAILTALDTSGHIKKLWISHSNLSSVDPDMLARVVNKLKIVDIYNTRLTRQQRTKILTHSLLTTNLKDLDMRDNETTIIRNTYSALDGGLVRQAEQVFKELYVGF